MIDLSCLRKRIRKTAGLARKLVSKEPGAVHPANQAARPAFVLGVILDHVSIMKNIADFLKQDVLLDHLLVRMRSDAYGIGLNLLAKAVSNGAVILNTFSVHCP